MGDKFLHIIFYNTHEHIRKKDKKLYSSHTFAALFLKGMMEYFSSISN